MDHTDQEPDDRDSWQGDPAFADALIEEQEEAAAAEAAGIGGANPAPGADPRLTAPFLTPAFTSGRYAVMRIEGGP